MKTDKILNVLLWTVSAFSLVLVIIATIFAFKTTVIFTRVILPLPIATLLESSVLLLLKISHI